VVIWVKVQDVPVTVGFSLQKFTTDLVNFTVFDMSGSGKYRNLWEHYYVDVKGIIFVIDSTDSQRMDVVKTELQTLLSHPDIASRSIPILFFSNKKDLPTSLDAAEISKLLDLPSVLDRPITIVYALIHDFAESIRFLCS
jgi:ADP-ribosylation factor-like protein 6